MSFGARSADRGRLVNGFTSSGPAVAERASDIGERVRELLTRMTLDQKIGQMTQPERMHASPAEVKRYHLTHRLGAQRRRLVPGGQPPGRLGGDERRLLGRIDGGGRRPPGDPAPLWRGRDSRKCQCAGRDDLPAQHRAGRHARPRPGRADRAGDGAGGAGRGGGLDLCAHAGGGAGSTLGADVRELLGGSGGGGRVRGQDREGVAGWGCGGLREALGGGRGDPRRRGPGRHGCGRGGTPGRRFRGGRCRIPVGRCPSRCRCRRSSWSRSGAVPRGRRTRRSIPRSRCSPCLRCRRTGSWGRAAEVRGRGGQGWVG